MLGTALERTYTDIIIAIHLGTYMNCVRCWEQPLNVSINTQFQKMPRTLLRTFKAEILKKVKNFQSHPNK